MGCLAFFGEIGQAASRLPGRHPKQNLLAVELLQDENVIQTDEIRKLLGFERFCTELKQMVEDVTKE